MELPVEKKEKKHLHLECEVQEGQELASIAPTQNPDEYTAKNALDQPIGVCRKKKDEKKEVVIQ